LANIIRVTFAFFVVSAVYVKCVIAAAAPVPELCIPKTPKFMSKHRARKITAPSQAQLEQAEVEEMKK